MYVDHSLIYVSIGGDRTEATYQKICKWFKKGHPTAGKGTFSLENNQLLGLSSNVQSNILIDFQGELNNHQFFIKMQSSDGAKGEYTFEYIGSVNKDGNITFADRNNFIDG